MLCFFLQDPFVCIIPTRQERFSMTLMFVTRQTRRLGFVYAIATLFFDVILGSRAVGQTLGGVEAKTITLGIVSPINEKKIEEHFPDFVRYVPGSTPTRPRSRDRSLWPRHSLGSPTYLVNRRSIFTWRVPIRLI